MNEVQLVLLAQSGDRSAFDELLRNVYPALLRYAGGLVGATAADDIVQDAAMQVHRKLRWLREPASFRPWAFRTVSRLAFAHLKRDQRWSSFEEYEGTETRFIAEESVESNVMWLSQLQYLASEVSPASRAVLLLHYQDGLQLEEIAAVLEAPLGTIKSRLSYGLTQVRRKLERKGPDGN
jgi:RNA polymerase sigma-70 factor (ECF subfamily)